MPTRLDDGTAHARVRATIPPRVCIVLLSAVGDVVHALPVVNALKRHDPCITWVLQPTPATLVRGHPAVDEIIVLDRSRGWRAFADVRRALHERRFDLALALQDYIKAGIITKLTRAPRRLGYDRARARDLNWLFTNEHIPSSPPKHIQDEYLEFVTALGIDPEPVVWNLGPWPDERPWQREFVSRIDRPIASLVIGSSRTEKDWLADRWADVANALYTDFGLQPVLVGARSAREVETERVVLERTAGRTRSALDSGLRRLVSILDASALVVSLDTGPLHMAVALERPVVGLLGYTNPERYGPYRRYHDLIVNAYGDTRRGDVLATDRRPGRMREITVSDVLDRVAIWRQHYASGRTTR